MTDEITELEFQMRRIQFIEACAYYVLLKNISVDELRMTDDLAELITERYRKTDLDWAIGQKSFYRIFLERGMQENLPNFVGEKMDPSIVFRRSFRSLVAKEVYNKKQLLAVARKMIPNKDTNGNDVWNSSLSHPAEQRAKPSATPHEILLGFNVHIKPDVHLDEMIPICARDQHLLFNIFGDKWKLPVIIDAYTSVKGQTGFMHNWTLIGCGINGFELKQKAST